MVWQRIRFALLAGAIVAVAAHPARAEDEAKPSAKPAAPAAAQPAAPAACQQYCTVKVWECVPETYTCEVTTYKTEQRVEKYTAYKCETVPVEKTRTVTCYKSVPETKMVKQEYTVCTPVCEERTVMKPCYSYRNVTKMVCKTEDHGHWECQEVPDHFRAFTNKLGHLCKRHGCGDSCGGCGNECAEECVPMKTKKCWVSCKVQVQKPVCVRERFCEMKPVTTKVTVMKREVRVRECQVTTCKMVAENRVEKYTVCETRRTPYEATRTVCARVPVKETVTKTRMVRRCVEKQVPVTPCEDSCGAGAGCCGGGHRLFGGGHSFFGGFKGHHGGGDGCCN
jgi:hypothetical protein